MSKSIRQLFEASQIELSVSNLEGWVFACLEKEQKSLARRRLLVFGLADVLSGAGLALSSLYLFNLLRTSGFYHYVSLFWSDFGLVNLYWQELLLSLVESLPMLGVIVSLVVTLALIFSLAKTVSNFKLFYYQANPA